MSTNRSTGIPRHGSVDGRCTSSRNQDTVDEPPNKKRKIEKLPCVVMQLNTFAHLKKLHDCINFRLKQLENNVVFVNVCNGRRYKSRKSRESRILRREAGQPK